MPAGGTCRSAEGKWSTIDYFIISRTLAQAAEAVHSVGSEPPIPHIPVRLQLSRCPRSYRERVLKRIKQFPLEHRVGCNPKPPAWEAAETLPELPELEQLNSLHSSFVNGLETELCNIYGLEEGERVKHCGRARAPRFEWRQSCGAITGNHPVSNAAGRSWRLVQRRLEDVGLALGRGRAMQVDNALKKVAVAMQEAGQTCGFHPATGHATTGRWRGLMSIGMVSQARAEVDEMAKWSAKQADRLEEAAAHQRTKAYRKWAKTATENGGGAAHAFTRVPTGWQEAVVPGGAHPSRHGMGIAGVSSDPQKVVEVELRKWCEHWHASEEPAAVLPPWPIMERLTPALGLEIRKVGNSFKWRTGLGLDQLHPRHLAMVSDGCLRALAFFFHIAEISGRWAGRFSVSSYWPSLREDSELLAFCHPFTGSGRNSGCPWSGRGRLEYRGSISPPESANPLRMLWEGSS